MKKTFLFIITALALGTVSSCTQGEKTSNEETQTSTLEIDDFNASINGKKMSEIDARIDPSHSAHSLVWERQIDGQPVELTEVIAYGDADGNLLKIEEKFLGAPYQPQGTRNYYLENDILIGVTEELDMWLDSLTSNWVEKRTIYDETGPQKTQMRSAYSYDEIEYEEWEDAPIEDYKLDKVNRILSGIEEFEPHFISVVKGESLFLILGENKKEVDNRYTTALRVDEMTPFIEDLLNNLEKYKFRPVNVRFTTVGGNNQPEFNVLTDISWKE